MHRSADTRVSEQPVFLRHDLGSRGQYSQNFPYRHQHTALRITASRPDSCFKIMGSALGSVPSRFWRNQKDSVKVDGKCWLRYPIINCCYLGASRALTSSLAVAAPSCLSPFT